MMNLAPVLLFVFNRPNHTIKLIESLKNNELSSDTELFVFVDVPKISASEEDKIKNRKVFELVNDIKHFKNVTVFRNEVNKGVDKSIIDGVNRIISDYKKVIVLEDDLLVASSFLSYMNWALNNFERNQRIYSVNGFMFPVDYRGSDDIVLLPYTSSWGWGTWIDRWGQFKFDEENRSTILKSKQISSQFNLPGVDYANMLVSHKECWDINWYFYVFKNSGLNVFPTKSLIKNMGFDGTGVHCTDIEFEQKFHFETQLNYSVVREKDITFMINYIDYFDRKKVESKSFFKSILSKFIKM